MIWSLIRQDFKAWDLIIVDDSDAALDWNNLGVYPRLFSEINRTGHRLKIAPGPRVSRIGAAYQTGLMASWPDNELFLRVDDDSWLEPDYLNELVSLFSDHEVSAAGGLFLHPGQGIETLSRDDPRMSGARIKNLSDQCNIQWFRHEGDQPIEVEHLTANILFRRESLLSIAGFETSLYRQHRDETQASWRLHVEGGKLLVNPKAVAWHLRGVTGGARGHSPDVYINDHRNFMAQRRTMKPGIHLSLSHGIGDGFMATPMLNELRKLNPERNIAVWAPWGRDLLKGNPDIDAIAEHPMDEQRTARIDISVYTWASANRWEGHLAQAYCRMLDLPTAADIRPRFHFIDEDQDFSLPKEIGEKPFILFAPWSSARTFDFYKPSENKNWIHERWSELVIWARNAGYATMQIRGSRDEPLIDGVDADMCGAKLRSAIKCISKASLVVSVDTMAHHGAAAFNIPSVVLWGRSKPEHFGYDYENIINIQGRCPGIEAETVKQGPAGSGARTERVLLPRPCVNNDQWAMDQIECPIKGRPCMSGITADEVIEAMSSLLLKTKAA
jgi:ADP-heptose:LPS heptosyltransferase